MDLSCFKAYDIRGRVPDQLDAETAYRIGRAFAEFLRPRNVVVGRDIRPSSPLLCDAVGAGLRDSGVAVHDIGLCGTEEVYFATFHEGMDGGIMVTASHNPADFNGMKLVREKAMPISGDSGLGKIRELAAANRFSRPGKIGNKGTLASKDAYINHLLTFFDRAQSRPRRIVVNPGNGCAGPILDALERHLPWEFVRICFEPDGTFPHGVPNPLLPENRALTQKAVVAEKADLGIAWDGDFDRCFFFDERGEFIEGYYLVGLLADYFLERYPGGKIIHDPRLTWNTIDIVNARGGIPVCSKTGHAFIKERMRLENAVYGGEMSAHHYFREFGFCDSGMIPWLLVLALMQRRNRPLSALVEERIRLYPASGEINRRVGSPGEVLRDLEETYRTQAVAMDHIDGLSMEMKRWRFNLRSSNTEPVIRLNVETRGDAALMREKTEEILARLDPFQ